MTAALVTVKRATRVPTLTTAREAWDKTAPMAESCVPLRIMLGFVVRQCARRLGHAPRPEELADWANNQHDERGRYRIFGRAISAEEAGIILRHPERLVTVRPGPRWEFTTTLAR